MNKNVQDRIGQMPGIGGGTQSLAIREPLDPTAVGTASVWPLGPFVAGSSQTITLTYTAGRYGIDDSGSLRICFRFASDQTPPQFDDPEAPNFTAIEASNQAVLECRYDPKGNVRPWDRTLYIKVVKGFLREGDTITVRFGVTDHGSPGMRIQTFCEETFEFHVLVDPIATFTYQPIAVQPTVKIVPGDPVRYAALIPTLRRTGEEFSLCIKGEDKWGNPSDRCDVTFMLDASIPVAGLPDAVTLRRGEFAHRITGLSVAEPGDLVVTLRSEEGAEVMRTNPLRVSPWPGGAHYWADLHGQSEESIGTGSAREYFTFARDRGFVDVTGHQANDFQITNGFWRQLNALSSEFDEPGAFCVLPGYEWSGNTALGGDRNVYFPAEGRPIRRSSHAMIEDRSDVDSDCLTATELFAALAKDCEWDTVVFAHCGGRYTDIGMAHDGRFEKSVEIHSSWGTFEWLLHDALEMGYRVGVVANSDGHKGRPGASYPGASLFGAVGGLTCLIAAELTREAVFDCLRKRHHYATTGGPTGRVFVDLRAEFETAGAVFQDDPKLGPAQGVEAHAAIMGDIVHLPYGGMQLSLTVKAAAPVERVDLFNGLEHLETIRPFRRDELGSRIRVIWEGAEYRGRLRQVVWDGHASVADNRIVGAVPINFLNPEKQLGLVGDRSLEWRHVTTGNLGGFDFWLADAMAGSLSLKTRLVECEVPFATIGYEDLEFDRSSALRRAVRIFRLPDRNSCLDFKITREFALNKNGDNAFYARITLEDGVIAWTSPLYIFR